MVEIIKKDGCLFCRIADHKIPSIIVAENKIVLAIMDINPATPGHILILPATHIEDIYGLPSEIGASIMEMAVSISGSIKKQLKPAGLNIIQSNGTAAGQVIFHYHMHLVPRYEGDSVRFRFGHTGSVTNSAELERLGTKIKSGLSP